MSSASWEFNPAYRCSLTDRKGFFKNLVDEALRSVGELHLDSRLSTFDDGLDVGENADDSEIPDTEASFDDSSYDYLNLILHGFKEIVRRLNSLERPSVSRHVLDREFLRSCQEAMAMIDDELSGSMDNHIGTDRRLKWDDVSADDVSADDASADVSATMDSVSTDRQSQLSDSSDDVKSETSDIVAWKCDIYDSAYDEYNFDIVDCRGGDVEWHSASDNSGRIYFFKENSSESSWTLPCQSPSPQPPNNVDSSPPPNPQQVAEEMSAIFNKISHVEVSDRRLRTTKAYSLIMPNRKDEPDLNFGVKSWPKPSRQEGQLTLKCEGPLHYTKIAEGNKRVRKNWSSAYVVLTEFFLLIYKDIKAFHTPRTQPELTIDLNGAVVSSGEKVSGRKHVLVVSSQCGLQVALQCENIHSVLFWATTIQHTVADIPKLKPPELVNTKLGSIGEAPAEEQTTTSKKGGSNIGRSKSVNFKNKDDSIEDLGGSPAERQVKIKARLRKFFHKRPTMDSLVKKGIWKDEPVFGTLLEQACASGGGCKDKEIGKVPLFVQKCINLIESSEENMKTDGLYRASGNLSQIQKIRLQIDQNNYTGLEKEEDVHVLTGALKLFFRELKEPLIPYKLFTKAMNASTKTNKKERLSMFVDVVKSLPTANRDTLKFLLQHLLRVTKYKDFNRMLVANLAIVFGPTLMWPEQESQNMASELMQQNMVIEALLLDFPQIFK
ncbi:rho GTPase activating protein [Nesidiocoris tenuis]|uniref:Rho GTPase activating protein n=1 Tax=Nesidiocoris tenuis TaxID=355587 RepID=A0ABN7AHN4_9HEMI|nr:rho GTPase activating protein [Nesidiocoris tenuis]